MLGTDVFSVERLLRAGAQSGVKEFFVPWLFVFKFFSRF
ncbi:potassium transporter KefC [Novimethylophilus kurashikiensis]|uniref:Potassium transporter KefC n=1 Tax=Novimethylophilus kurashikiensis TaxID=1825523 RepID=A0A2R5F8F0_9PROT|nr:potassium transporter KefC [Novimethylophilus kurashikiensis]